MENEIKFPKKKKRVGRRKKSPEEADLERLVEDLLERARRGPCAACGKTPCDPDHIKTRGSGGQNRLENVWPLCREHHTQKGAIGLSQFVERYPKARQALLLKGWTFDEFLRKWVK